MTGAHSRLAALWDALEAQGAVVHRIQLDTITARTANRLASREEHRLAILAEELLPSARQPCGKPADVLHGLPPDLARLFAQLSTGNPQGRSPSDPHALHRIVEHTFRPDGEVA